MVALNQRDRSLPAELAQQTGIDRTTVYRLLATLESHGYVTHSDADDRYILTKAVRELSDGFTSLDHVARVVPREMGSLLSQVLWPSDFATYELGNMVIRESTHRFSAYSIHRGMIGRNRPLLNSAVGRAVLASSSESERVQMLEIARGAGTITASQRDIDQQVEHLLQDYAQRGYTWSIGQTESRISAIALPIIVTGRAIGAINIIFFRSALSIEIAASRYLDPLRASVKRIEEELHDLPLHR